MTQKMDDRTLNEWTSGSFQVIIANTKETLLNQHQCNNNSTVDWLIMALNTTPELGNGYQTLNPEFVQYSPDNHKPNEAFSVGQGVEQCGG